MAAGRRQGCTGTEGGFHVLNSFSEELGVPNGQSWTALPARVPSRAGRRITQRWTTAANLVVRLVGHGQVGTDLGTIFDAGLRFRGASAVQSTHQGRQDDTAVLCQSDRRAAPHQLSPFWRV